MASTKNKRLIGRSFQILHWITLFSSRDEFLTRHKTACELEQRPAGSSQRKRASKMRNYLLRACAISVCTTIALVGSLEAKSKFGHWWTENVEKPTKKFGKWWTNYVEKPLKHNIKDK